MVFLSLVFLFQCSRFVLYSVRIQWVQAMIHASTHFELPCYKNRIHFFSCTICFAAFLCGGASWPFTSSVRSQLRFFFFFYFKKLSVGDDTAAARGDDSIDRSASLSGTVETNHVSCDKCVCVRVCAPYTVHERSQWWLYAFNGIVRIKLVITSDTVSIVNVRALAKPFNQKSFVLIRRSFESLLFSPEKHIPSFFEV